jgi:hypothetical protein
LLSVKLLTGSASASENENKVFEFYDLTFQVLVMSLIKSAATHIADLVSRRA